MELQFPLPIPDMNNEVIRRLDDDALYKLCRTSTDVERLCSMSGVWDRSRPSELRPLRFLAPLYDNWIDFYENVRHDYIYVVVAKYRRMIDFDDVRDAVVLNETYDIAEAVSIVLKWLKFKDLTNLKQLQQDLSGRLTNPYEVIVGLARRGTEYTGKVPYDNVLYKVSSLKINEMVPDLQSYPLLSSTPPVVVAHIGDSKAIFSESRIRYVTLNKENVRNLIDNNFRFAIGRVLFAVEQQKILSGELFHGSMENIKVVLLFIIPDTFIDGSDDYRLVAVDEALSKRLRSLPDLQAVSQLLKQFGVFYKLEDLLAVIEQYKTITIAYNKTLDNREVL